jgi:hypothetical protein
VVAVDFDAQARLGAIEVEKVGSDGRLAPEVKADLVAAQARPEAFFRLAHLTAHLTSACDTVGLPVAVRHAVLIRFRATGSCWISPPSLRFPPLREGNRAGIRVRVRAKRKMRPDSSGRTLLTSRKWGVWNSTPQPQTAGLSSSGGDAAPADPPDPNPAQSCSQVQGRRKYLGDC